MGKIVTSYEFPPIPSRHFDWCAHYDDPEGPTGWGATEQEAIEECAKIADRWAACESLGATLVARTIASAIRSRLPPSDREDVKS